MGKQISAMAIGATLLTAPAPLFAQAAPPPQSAASGENALRSADDAFGTSVGRESIGLYNSGNVRGFSPVAAGNVRVDGLYFDAVAVPNGRLAGGSTIRVGISAQGYPFPAPTGIVDYRLRLPGDEASARATVGAVSSNEINGDFDLRLPIDGGRLGIAGGVNFTYAFPSTIEPVTHGGAALLLRWRPTDRVELVPFWSHFIHRDDPAQPRFVVAGDYLPPEIDREAKLIQPWALNDVDESVSGVLGRAGLGEWRLSAGLFRSLRNADVSYSDQFLNVSATGVAATHRLVATPAQRTVGTSGELRVSRDFLEGDRAHRVHFALRGRRQDRRYGGSAAIDFGRAFIGGPPRMAQPDFAFGPQSRDRVRQWTGGVAYEGRWPGVGELSLGLQRTDYRKAVEIPGRAVPDAHDKPWLYNAALAVHATPEIAAYASVTRGLEESPVAPDVAVNRDEAPPALETRQVDGGVRWAITPKLKLIAGLFDVRKPYFNLDPANLYRRLGDVRHRGAELSLSGELLPHLQVVAGAVLLDAEVSGDAFELGIVGKKPVGSTDRTLLLNAEYSPEGLSGFSVDAGVNAFGRRVANSANTLSLPASATVSAGMRYRWTISGTPLALRVQASNLLNDYAWELRSSNAFYFTFPRAISARLSVDL